LYNVYYNRDGTLQEAHKSGIKALNFI